MSRPLLLTNARIVDERGEVGRDVNLQINRSTITAIDGGSGDGVETIIDVAGRTVCPGLMNAHVHVSFDGSIDPSLAFLSEDAVESALNALPRLAEIVARGVTTVRDLGGKHEVTIALADAVERGAIVGPRIVAAGRVITMTGGHGHWMGLEVDGADSARKATRLMIKAGARVIKLMATAGMMTSGQIAGAPQLTVDEMSACVEEAHKAGLPVAAHTESRNGAANALDAGVDSIEHGHGLDEPLLEHMQQRGVVLVPTIACDRAITREGRRAGVPSFVVDDCARLAPSLEWALKRAIEIGVPIAAGNDGGAPITHPGDIVDELAIYVELGMTPVAALASATTATAALFGLGDVGRIEPGYRADLLIVDGDPLESVESLRSPDMVFAGGQVVHGGQR